MKPAFFVSAFVAAFIVGLTLGLFVGVAIMLDYAREEAVVKGKGEYYLDDNRRRQWRWKP